MNQYERAYKDYCEYSKKEEIDYVSLYRWAMTFNIQAIIMFYPEGFSFEIDYDEGTLSSQPKDDIIEAIEDMAESLFSIIEGYLDEPDIFSEMAQLRDCVIHGIEESDIEKLEALMMDKAKECWLEMVEMSPKDPDFREKFLDMCMYIATAINHQK